MSQRLFNTAKVPVFIDSVQLGVEKRKDGPVSVVVLGCRVQPFDAKLASSLDQGVGDGNIKATAFNLNSAEPKKAFTRHDFALGLARQRLECFATPDSPEARIALDGTRIYGTYVRSQKDMPTALAMIFKASFGPVGRDELDYVKAHFRSQLFVTFREADQSMQFEAEDVDEGDEEGSDADIKARQRAPMFDDGGKETPESEPADDDKEPVNRKLHTGRGGKKKLGRDGYPKAVARAAR
jgi:hypothetical protein